MNYISYKAQKVSNSNEQRLSGHDDMLWLLHLLVAEQVYEQEYHAETDSEHDDACQHDAQCAVTYQVLCRQATVPAYYSCNPCHSVLL